MKLSRKNFFKINICERISGLLKIPKSFYNYLIPVILYNLSKIILGTSRVQLYWLSTKVQVSCLRTTKGTWKISSVRGNRMNSLTCYLSHALHSSATTNSQAYTNSFINNLLGIKETTRRILRATGMLWRYRKKTSQQVCSQTQLQLC